MKSTIILRFRDLITEDDGTIDDHLNLIANYGEVWWGWWMKQNEIPPKDLFKSLVNLIYDAGGLQIYLYNTGLHKIYEAYVTKIFVAPLDYKISTPDPEKSPNYYHRGSYPAWFLINRIVEIDFTSIKLKLVDLPTKDEQYRNENSLLFNKEISNLSDLQQLNVTLWEVSIN